jgi:hypothetical protein
MLRGLGIGNIRGEPTRVCLTAPQFAHRRAALPLVTPGVGAARGAVGGIGVVVGVGRITVAGWRSWPVF